jgi:RND family efflux transporter MFP subunit
MTRVNWLAALLPALALGQAVETVQVVSQPVKRMLRLPGELLPFEQVALSARVNGFVEAVAADRGSAVKAGDLLVKLAAPEMQAQAAEARARAGAIEAAMVETRAKIAAAESSWQRLKQASETPGVVAGNDLLLAEKELEAARATLEAQGAAREAARASLVAVEEMLRYLEVRAPFAGTITERLVHPGALAGPQTGPLLRLEQLNPLRLVVAVPEASAGGIDPRAQIHFSVPAYPGRQFSASVSRLARSLDAKTRTMAVEADVPNSGGALAPGMYAEVNWPVSMPQAALLVPPTAIVTTTERAFVVRVVEGKAEWVTVRRGSPAGDLVEVFGALRTGDVIARRASDELRDGAAIQTKPAAK